MSVEYLNPASDVSGSDWLIYPTSPATFYDKVDEGSEHDSDSTYIYSKTFAAEDEWDCLFNPEAHDIPDGSSISSVKVCVYAYRTASAGPNINLKIILGESSTVSDTITLSYTEYTLYDEVFDEKPGGGAWSLSDINNIDFGFRHAENAKSGISKVTACWLEVTWTADEPVPIESVASIGFLSVISQDNTARMPMLALGGTTYWPHSIQVDRITNPENSSDNPLFSCVVDFDDEDRTADAVKIRIGTERYANDVWDSAWITITSTAHGDRTSLVSYDGATVLGSGRTYHVQMKVKDDLDAESAWSADDAVFEGVVSDWWDSAWIFRKRLRWPEHHSRIDAGDTCVFTTQTGLREPVADDSFYNEGVDFARHSILYHKGKTHVAYLSELNKSGADPEMDIMITTKDHQTNTWSTPIKVSDSGTDFDTHYFPVLAVTPDDDKLHIFYGCHNTAMKYRRSVNANDSSSWIAEVSLGGMMSYPHAFALPNNRLYVFARGTSTLDNLRASFKYSDDSGATWSAWREFALNNLVDAARTYLWGLRVDYNADPIRLHIVLDFTVIPSGQEGYTSCSIYAYSDYDDTKDDGWYQWFTHNDESSGYTAVSNALIRRWDLEESPLHTSDIIWDVEYGPRDAKGSLYCFLDSTYQPHVILTAYQWGNDRWHHSLGIATIDGTGWDINWFTKDLDIDVWHARQGAVTMMDENGIIHLYAVVCPKRYSINLPTGNGSHTDWTKSDANQEYFGLVDDDRIDLDEDTYLSTTTVGHKCSFTFSFDLPEYAEVLAVNVSFYAKETGTGNCEVRPFLRISTTDYEATSTEIDAVYMSTNGPADPSGHVEYNYTWWTNPATSSDWVEADLTGLQAGLKYHADLGESHTVYLARLQCRILIMQAGHSSWFAGALVEFLSADDGATWTYRMLGGGAAYGLPIVNMKETYTNRQIEMMYVCGNQMMYYMPQTWGFMRTDGSDLRLVYNGVEINRLTLDYFNMVDTQIAFAAPEAIPAHSPYPPKNLYMYWGNPNADRPLQDPHEVFTHYEGFEEYAHGTSIDTIAGWSIKTDTVATVYQASRWLQTSLYNHNNKVYAGLQALRIYAVGGGESWAMYTLDDELTNVIIEVAMWNEGDAQSYMELADSRGNIFKAGFSDVGRYYDGDWHDSSVNATKTNQNLVRCHVTPNGVSAFVRGEQICSNNTALRYVKSLKFEGGSLSKPGFYDHIQIRTFMPIEGEIGFDDTEYHGDYYSATIVGTQYQHNQADATIDGYHLFSRMLGQYSSLQEESTRQLAPYNIISAQSSVADMPYSSTTQYEAAVHVPAQLQLIKDIITQLPVDSLSDWSAFGMVPMDSATRIGLYSYLPLNTQIEAGALQHVPIETTTGASICSHIPFAGQMIQQSISQLPFAGTSIFETGAVLTFDSLIGFRSCTDLPLATSAGFGIYHMQPLMTMRAFDNITQSHFNSQVDVIALQHTPIGVVTGLNVIAHAPFGTQTMEIRIAHIPYSHTRVFECAGMLPFDSLIGFDTCGYAPVNAAGGFGAYCMQPIMTMRATENTGQLHYDFLTAYQTTGYTPTDSLSRFEAPTYIQHGMCSGMSSAANLHHSFRRLWERQEYICAEWQKSFDALISIPVCIQQTLIFAARVPYYTLGMTSYDATSNVAYYTLRGQALAGYQPLMTVQGRNAYGRIETSSTAAFDSAHRMPLLIRAARSSCVRLGGLELLVDAHTLTSSGYQTLLACMGFARMPYRSSGGVAMHAAAHVPILTLRSLDAVAHAEYHSLIIMPGLFASLPYHNMLQQQVVAHIPYRSGAGIVIESASHIPYLSLLPVNVYGHGATDSLVAHSATTHIQYRSSGGLSMYATGHIPFLSTRTFTGGAHMPYDHLILLPYVQTTHAINSMSARNVITILPFVARCEATSLMTTYIPFNTRAAFSGSAHIGLQSQQIFDAATQLPYDIVARMERLVHIMQHSDSAISSQASLSLYTGCLLSECAHIGFEFLNRYPPVTINIPYETLEALSVYLRMPIDSLGVVVIGLVADALAFATYDYWKPTLASYTMTDITWDTLDITDVTLLPADRIDRR